jgi:hypothetical protein
LLVLSSGSIPLVFGCLFSGEVVGGEKNRKAETSAARKNRSIAGWSETKTIATQ